MTLAEAAERIGSLVTYQPPGAVLREDGWIIRVSDSYVFVRFAGDLHATATRAEDLTLPDGVHP